MRKLIQVGLLALATTCFSSPAVAQNAPHPWTVQPETIWTVQQCFVGTSNSECSFAPSPRDFPLLGDYLSLSKTANGDSRFALVQNAAPPLVKVFDVMGYAAGTRPITVNGQTYLVPYNQTDFQSEPNVYRRLEFHLVHGGGLPSEICQTLLDELSELTDNKLTCDPANDHVDLVHWRICTLDGPGGACARAMGDEDDADDDDVRFLIPPDDSQGTGTG